MTLIKRLHKELDNTDFSQFSDEDKKVACGRGVKNRNSFLKAHCTVVLDSIENADPATTKKEKNDFYREAFADFTERGGEFVSLRRGDAYEKYSQTLRDMASQRNYSGIKALWKSQDRGFSSTVDVTEDDRKPAASAEEELYKDPLISFNLKKDLTALADILPAKDRKRPRSGSFDSWNILKEDINLGLKTTNLTRSGSFDSWNSIGNPYEDILQQGR